MTSMLSRIPTLVVSTLLLTGLAWAKSYRVTVAASDADRAVQVIEVGKLPANAGAIWLAHGEGDAAAMTLPVQVAEDGAAAFIVPAQKARQTLTFILEEGRTAAAGTTGVAVNRNAGNLQVTVGGKLAFAYQMDKDALPRPDIKPEYKRAGYLHPIATPSGTVVSDDYPVQHVHHHGIWTPWTKTSFQGRKPDFWNMGQKTGTVEFVALDRTWTGPVHGGFVARHKFIDLSAPSPVLALHETWEVTGYKVPAGPVNGTVFELVVTQTCATDDPLILPEYHYGGFGFRGRGEWLGRDKAKFLTSEGTTDRVKANHERMRWVHLWGDLAGGPAGLTVMGHPGNFRAPMPVRVHPNEPYVSFIPSQLGEWKIEPGRPYVARYRFVAFDGAPDRAQLDALWNGYAVPAVVKVEGAP